MNDFTILFRRRWDSAGARLDTAAPKPVSLARVRLNECRWETWRRFAVSLFLPLVFGCWAGNRPEVNGPPEYLTQMTLEELLNLEVTSVSKKIEDLSKAPAAVFVITQEDMRRSGSTSIADALRMVPGMEVSHLDANQWAVTSRGFNGPFANKLLVLIDGRSIYTPLFSGVYWDAQDVLMEDMDRIEVIRGPGATLWGANAVNGVINIITKSAEHTKGGQVISGIGSEERGFGRIRYGGGLGRDAWYRAYAKYYEHDNFVDKNGKDAADAWDVLQGGFRTDWEIAGQDALTLQGDIYKGNTGHTLTIAALDSPFARTTSSESDIAGSNLLGRWRRHLSEASESTLQLYFDRTNRDLGFYREIRKTYDLDFHHRFGLGDRQEIIWGLGYRITTDDVVNTESFLFSPANRDLTIYGVFVQDEITLAKDRLSVRLGSKLEHNSITDFEFQPGARLLWTPNDRQTMWGAVSRAARTPSRAENDLTWVLRTYPPGALYEDSPTAFVTLLGNPNFHSEQLTAYELGYRVRPHENLAFDVATFYNVYDDLRTIETGPPVEVTEPEHIIVPFWADNKMEGDTYGIEMVTDWQPLPRWRLRSAYSFLRVQLDPHPDSMHQPSQEEEWVSPRHLFSLSSFVDLPHGWEFDARMRFVDKQPTLVERYVVLDLHLGWKLTESLEFSVVGKNLLDDQRLEFMPQIERYIRNEFARVSLDPERDPAFFDILSTHVQRGAYARFAWRF